MAVVVFVVSAAVLAHEIALLRALCVAWWSHGAALVVSTALLGFAAAGVLLAARPGWRRPRTVAAGAIAYGVLAPASLRAAAALGPDLRFLGWDLGAAWGLLALQGVFLVPFLAAAVSIYASFCARPSRAGVLYAANLLGSGLGAVAAGPLLSLAPPGPVIGGLAALAALAGGAMGGLLPRAAAAVVAAAALPVALPGVPMAAWKDLPSTPSARVVASRIGPHGQVDLVESPFLHMAPGLSLLAGADPPRQRGLFVDGHLVAALDEEPTGWAEEATGALPFVLSPRPRVLLLGVGPDLGRATEVVEADANLLALSGAPGPAAPPRAFLDATRERWDAVLLHVAWQDPVRETPLLTVEGLARALDRTTPGGVVAVSTALAAPPRADARLLRTAERVTPHLVAVRSVDRLTVVLARRAPDAAALARATAFAERLGFDLVRPRGLGPPPVHRAGVGLDDPGPDYPYDVAPVTDARPYFHRFFRWSRLGDLASHEAVPFVEWGFAVLVLGFAQVAVLGALLLLGPLVASRAARAPAPLFLALGAGYMAVEMAWFARGTVLLGNAVPSAAAVIGGFLVGSGLGSLAARRLGGPLRRAAAASAVLAVAGLFVLPAWGPGIALLAAVAAFPMGIPFPTALACLPEASVPWALAVNGWAGVTAAAAAPLLSSTWGIAVTAALGSACYLGVALGRRGPSDL